jgi:hypothetical protein
MTKFLLFLLSVLIIVPGDSVASQSRQSGPKDPVLTAIRSHEPDYADSSTRRLEVLTEIWGNIGLYDPRPSARQLKWDDVLIAALRELPHVRGEH